MKYWILFTVVGLLGALLSYEIFLLAWQYFHNEIASVKFNTLMDQIVVFGWALAVLGCMIYG
jgi:hypothetical protein